jgi:precorrin-4/cobalt-precorrin-4 C11-methyltransferase
LQAWSIQQRCLELPYHASFCVDCPVIVAYRVSWPDELLMRGTQGDTRDRVKKARITGTAPVLVGPTLAGERGTKSRLYTADHHHSMRPRR